MTPSDALEWRADGHIIVVGGVLQASCADDADAWTLARWHNEVAGALRDARAEVNQEVGYRLHIEAERDAARAETAELRSRIEAVAAEVEGDALRYWDDNNIPMSRATSHAAEKIRAALFPAEEAPSE